MENGENIEPKQKEHQLDDILELWKTTRTQGYAKGCLRQVLEEVN